MKMSILRIALPLACLIMLASGCIFDNHKSQVVLKESVVVQFQQNLTSPSIGSSVVADKFKERLMAALTEQHASLQDVESITMVCGSYKVTMASKAKHDWVITGTVTMARQDNSNGPVTQGPANFIDLFNQSLAAAKSKPVKANLDAAGVAIVDSALVDLLKGINPRLVIRLQSSNIVPAPSTTDPLVFNWLAEVTFQAVVDVHTGKGHGGHH